MKKMTVVAEMLLISASLLILSGCSSAKSAPTVSASSPQMNTIQIQEPTPEPSPKYYFEENILVTEDVRIEIVDCEIIQIGEPGNEHGEKPVIVFTYDTTNLTGNEAVNPISAWIAFFTAVQDNDPNYVNVLDIGMAPYDEYLDTQSATIKKGGTVRDATAYELDDLETPVLLIAQRIMDDEPLGEQTYDVVELASK